MKYKKELICPDCGGECKEYVTKHKCRKCDTDFRKKFQVIPRGKMERIRKWFKKRYGHLELDDLEHIEDICDIIYIYEKEH